MEFGSVLISCSPISRLQEKCSHFYVSIRILGCYLLCCVLSENQWPIIPFYFLNTFNVLFLISVELLTHTSKVAFISSSVNTNNFFHVFIIG